MARMKIRVAYTVEVDVDEWTLTYGTEGREAVREDVKEYFFDQICNSPPAEECSLTAKRAN